MNKISFSELKKYLTEHKDGKGVIVFKVHPSWKHADYSLEDRSYRVIADNKYFKPCCIGNSLYGTNLSQTDINVRLDWYMFNGSESWQVEYCYILEDEA